jgi:hypothetical protein
MSYFSFFLLFGFFFLEERQKNAKNLMKRRPPIWENNRQKPIDPSKYCSICRYEYSKRAKFLVHVQRAHKGIIPPLINEPDQSLFETIEVSKY